MRHFAALKEAYFQHHGERDTHSGRTLFRTKPCTFARRGHCFHSDFGACFYAHSWDEQMYYCGNVQCPMQYKGVECSGGCLFWHHGNGEMPEQRILRILAEEDEDRYRRGVRGEGRDFRAEGQDVKGEGRYARGEGRHVRGEGRHVRDEGRHVRDEERHVRGEGRNAVREDGIPKNERKRLRTAQGNQRAEVCECEGEDYRSSVGRGKENAPFFRSRKIVHPPARRVEKKEALPSKVRYLKNEAEAKQLVDIGATDALKGGAEKAMTMDDWKRLEKLFLSGNASGPEQLAFKMVRDAMLSPCYAAESRNLVRPDNEDICNPPSDPETNMLLDILDAKAAFSLKNTACTMREMIDPFHRAVCGEHVELDDEESVGRERGRKFQEGTVAGVIHGRTSIAVVPPPGACRGIDNIENPSNRVIDVIGSKAPSFHSQSVALDPTFLKINSVFCPSLERYLVNEHANETCN